MCVALAVVLFVALEHLVLDELDDFAQGERFLAGPAHEHVIVAVRCVRSLGICCGEAQRGGRELVKVPDKGDNLQ